MKAVARRLCGVLAVLMVLITSAKTVQAQGQAPTDSVMRYTDFVNAGRIRLNQRIFILYDSLAAQRQAIMAAIAQHEGTIGRRPYDTTGLAVGKVLFFNGVSFVLLDTSQLGGGGGAIGNEQIDDRVSVLIQNGTGITWSYNDVNGTFTPTVGLAPFSTTNLAEGVNEYYTNERVDDRVALSLILPGTGISWNYDDGAGTYTPTISLAPFSTSSLSEGTRLYYTDERVDDRAALLIQNGTGISWSYNDGANTFTPTISLSSFSTTNLSEGTNLYFTDDRADDRTAVLIQNGTGISWAYNDGANTFTPTISLSAFSTTNLSEGTNLYFTYSRLNNWADTSGFKVGGQIGEFAFRAATDSFSTVPGFKMNGVNFRYVVDQAFPKFVMHESTSGDSVYWGINSTGHLVLRDGITGEKTLEELVQGGGDNTRKVPAYLYGDTSKVLRSDSTWKAMANLDTANKKDGAPAIWNQSGNKFTMSTLPPAEWGVAVTPETTIVVTGATQVTFRMPFAMTLTSIRASLSTASSSGVVTLDVNEGGASVFSTLLTIDANEKTSTTAATSAVLSDTVLADDAEITVDVDGAGTGAKGVKILLKGTRLW